MASKPPTRSAKKAPAKRRAKAPAPPAVGPVTLEEARALAKARLPQGAKPTSAPRADAEATASLAALGKQRQALVKQRRADIAQRRRDYTATMKIMKARGTRPPRAKPPGGKGGPETKEGGFAPLQVLAEGDSWFDYPVPLFGGGIIPRLEQQLGVPILNLAKAGDEVRYMLGVEERQILSEQLRQGCPAGGPWEVLLFSGGGNDIVGNPMALWVRDWDPARPPREHLRLERFAAAVTLIRAGYDDLIEMRDQLSPTTHLVFHGYDFAIPDGRGICWLGPWLKPTFDLRGFPNRPAAMEVVRGMLETFATMLLELATRPRVTVLTSQGTLSPTTASWHNELHPASRGFDRFATLFHEQLRHLFPGRVA